MHEITMHESDAVGGGGFLAWVAMQGAVRAVEYVFQQTINGNVDYSSLAESQGTYYNMVGS